MGEFSRSSPGIAFSIRVFVVRHDAEHSTKCLLLSIVPTALTLYEYEKARVLPDDRCNFVSEQIAAAADC
jgi:hypothetical protein